MATQLSPAGFYWSFTRRGGARAARKTFVRTLAKSLVLPNLTQKGVNFSIRPGLEVLNCPANWEVVPKYGFRPPRPVLLQI